MRESVVVFLALNDLAQVCHRWRILLRLGAAAAAIFLLVGPTPGSASTAPVQVRRGIEYARVGGVRLLLDAYLPPTGTAHPALIFVHGGGWRAGDRASFAPGEQGFASTGRRFAGLGYAVFSVDYRLAPAFRFPAQLADVRAAIRWVRAHSRRYRVDGRRLGLFGVSAGGNLAALAALRGRGDLASGTRVRALVVWSSPMDLLRFASAGRPQVAEYLGCSAASCPGRYRAASPTSWVDPSDPPTLIANGTSEIVPLVQAQALARRLHAAGVSSRLLVIPGARHAAEYEAVSLPATIQFLRLHLR